MHTESRSIAEQPTAVVHTTLGRDELAAWFGRTFDEVAEYLRRHGSAPQGLPFARYHVHADGRFEVEAGYPVAARIVGDGHVRPSHLPGGDVVVAWHIGPYEELGEAYQAIDEWLKAEGGTRTGDAWEVYHDPPTGNPRFWRTEVIQPFEPARADAR